METRGPIRVLVVDDEKPLQELLKASLEAFGLNVAGVANNGAEALTEYERLKPDAVVMDIRMPVMDGITALGKLKEAHPESCVLMITANQEEAQRQEALKIGANGFLHKPFRVDELFQDIQRAFRSVVARKADQSFDDQYVRYVLNQGPTVQAPMRAVMPPASPAMAAAAGTVNAPVSIPGMSAHNGPSSNPPVSKPPVSKPPEFGGSDVALRSGETPVKQVDPPSRPSAMVTPESEIARLKLENRELREQLQHARDTAAQLVETLQKALSAKR